MPAFPRIPALVVESNPRVLRHVMRLLRKAGHDVRGAPEAVEACVILQSFRPQVALIDPQLDCVETVIDRLRRLRGIQLIALCQGDPFHARVSLWAGHVRRPVEAAVLSRVLAAIASHRETV
jgi:DNA-binding response OmpR family regulator